MRGKVTINGKPCDIFSFGILLKISLLMAVTHHIQNKPLTYGSGVSSTNPLGSINHCVINWKPLRNILSLYTTVHWLPLAATVYLPVCFALRHTSLPTFPAALLFFFGNFVLFWVKYDRRYEKNILFMKFLHTYDSDLRHVGNYYIRWEDFFEISVAHGIHMLVKW